ncbi:MAG: sulfite exporter TauE/SafE family protein [Chlorobi bacterium]|nr:sulfite exporter TauE/SafE family protein [Chlorobiota bacterium]
MDLEIVFFVLLAITALLYSSVGHGGASGYLALMAIFAMAPEIMKSSALTLNLFVSATAFYSFYKNGHFKWSILVPLIIASVPAAFIGAGVTINPKLYKLILGLCLLIAIVRMLVVKSVKFDNIKKPSWASLLLTGGVIGFLSGVIGIGGGIILSPLILLFRWANVKETAGISALFIFLNSTAGIIGLNISGLYATPNIAFWVIAVVIGGVIGSFLGSFKFSKNRVRYILATVLLLASFKLFLF